MGFRATFSHLPLPANCPLQLVLDFRMSASFLSGCLESRFCHFSFSRFPRCEYKIQRSKKRVRLEEKKIPFPKTIFNLITLQDHVSSGFKILESTFFFWHRKKTHWDYGIKKGGPIIFHIETTFFCSVNYKFALNTLAFIVLFLLHELSSV